MLQATLLLAAASGRLYLDGDGSAIEFGSNTARLTASCDAKQAAVGYLSHWQLMPATESTVQVFLRNVPALCAGSAVASPCASPLEPYLKSLLCELPAACTHACPHAARKGLPAPSLSPPCGRPSAARGSGEDAAERRIPDPGPAAAAGA